MGFWSELHTKMQADLASGNWRVSSYSVGNDVLSYTSLDEFLSALDRVAAKAATEAGRRIGRTYAKNGGRG